MTHIPGVAPARSGWVLSGKRSLVAAAVSGTFDISNCSKFRVEVQNSAASSANWYMGFGSDFTAANYSRQSLYATGTAGAVGQVSTYAGLLVGTANAFWTATLEFSKTSKSGIQNSFYSVSSTMYFQFCGWRYLGADAMNVLTVSGATFSGDVAVYRWVD